MIYRLPVLYTFIINTHIYEWHISIRLYTSADTYLYTSASCRYVWHIGIYIRVHEGTRGISYKYLNNSNNMTNRYSNYVYLAYK